MKSGDPGNRPWPVSLVHMDLGTDPLDEIRESNARDEEGAGGWWRQWRAKRRARMGAKCADERQQPKRDNQGQRRGADWQRRVFCEAAGSMLKVEIGQACWPKKIMGRLLKSLDAWEKEYGIECVLSSPEENRGDPSAGCIWVRGHPGRMASAEDGAES